MQDSDVQAYWQRIGSPVLHGSTYRTLQALQTAHLRTVPYENLDIVDGIPLDLSTDALLDKIVRRRRGGYCFELNALFGTLLRALGFSVVDHFARFLLGTADIPMRRHQVLVVTPPGADQAYLCDVGVGAMSPNCPLPLAAGYERREGGIRYRLVRDAFLGWVLEFEKHGAWEKLYSFTEEPQLPVDFTAISFYCEHSPNSIFNKAPMVALRTKDGRYTLDGDTFKHFYGQEVKVWREATDVLFAQTLAELFGIVR